MIKPALDFLLEKYYLCTKINKQENIKKIYENIYDDLYFLKEILIKKEKTCCNKKH